MAFRRRPVAALLAALLVWLSAFGSARGAFPRELRLTTGDETMPAMSAAVPRPLIAATREVSRLPAVGNAPTHLLPGESVAAPQVPAVARNSTAAHSRVRQVQGTASTYDALGPPVWLLAIGR